jgi:excisionase family DNA binding protein
MITPQSNSLLSIAAACKKLGVGKTTLYDLVAKKKIAVVKIGSRTLFADSELDRFISELIASAA